MKIWIAKKNQNWSWKQRLEQIWQNTKEILKNYFRAFSKSPQAFLFLVDSSYHHKPRAEHIETSLLERLASHASVSPWSLVRWYKLHCTAVQALKRFYSFLKIRQIELHQFCKKQPSACPNQVTTTMTAINFIIWSSKTLQFCNLHNPGLSLLWHNL